MDQSGMNELDRVEILTLQDNDIDMTATDNSEMIRRAGMRAVGEKRKSVLAEHGFSAVEVQIPASPIHKRNDRFSENEGEEIDPGDRSGDARELSSQHVGDTAHFCRIGKWKTVNPPTLARQGEESGGHFHIRRV